MAPTNKRKTKNKLGKREQERFDQSKKKVTFSVILMRIIFTVILFSMIIGLAVYILR